MHQLPIQDYALQEWQQNHVDQFLFALLEEEGLGETNPARRCGGCNEPSKPLHRCKSCSSPLMLCSLCIVAQHGYNPLHRIEVSGLPCVSQRSQSSTHHLFGRQAWTGTHFEKTSLKDLELVIQLGHPIGDKCHRPRKPKDDKFVVLSNDFIQYVTLRFCGCGGTADSDVDQLLKRGLFPATTTAPQTAATFRCLETFEVLQYESKLSALEYYQTLVRLTDNTGLTGDDDPKVSRNILFRVFDLKPSSRVATPPSSA